MANYLATILADNPTALYRMDDTVGTIAHDVSGNNNHAKLSGNFTLNQPGALKGDANPAIFFADAVSGMTLPTSLNYTAFSAFSLEFWITQQGNWQYITVTCDGTTTLTYFNGLPYTPGSPAPVEISAVFAWAGSYNAASIDEVGVYNYVLSSAQVLNHYQVGITPVFTNQSTLYFKTQIVKCYDSSGNFIDIIRDAPYLSGFTEAVNAATTSITVPLPRRIDAYDGQNMPNSKGTVTLGNVWKWYLYGPGLPSSGLLRYQGIVDTIRPHVDENGAESVDVTITPYSQILGDHAIMGPITYGTAGNSATYVDSGTMFSNLLGSTDPITSLPYMSPFTLDPGNPATTGIKSATSFQNQTLLSAMTTILLLSPANYYFRPNINNTLTFNQYNLSTPDYILQIGNHITSMEYSIDNVPRKNVCAVQGKGVFAKAVGTSVSQIGERVYFKSDNRITDVNTAQTLANGLLSFYDRSQIRTKVKIPDYRGDLQAGLGYDIEKFKPGQTVVILDSKAPASSALNAPTTWGNFVWGTGVWGATSSTLLVGGVFGQVVPIVAVNYGFHYCELELGFRQPSMLRALYNLESRYQDSSLVS